ncbi:MAG: TlpA disulfide reductase family protein [Bacteroidales bacterium]
MKKIIYTFPIFLTIIMMGCGGNKADENSFVIKGKLTDTKKDSIYLKELTVKEMVSIDSSVVSEEGEFYFKVKPKEIGFYILKLKKNNFLTLLINKGETVEIIADAKQLLKTYIISGSKGSELIKELNDHLQANYTKVDSLSRIYNDSKGSTDILKIKASLDSTYKEIFFDQKNFLKNFIDKNAGSLACLIAIYQQFGRELLFNVNDKTDFAYFEKLDKALITAYPDNQHSQDLHKRVAEIKRMEAEKQLAENKLDVGFKAPDFKLETPDGKSVSLSSFKGKFVLIDFWASWCAPCRQENPKMIKLYKQYKDKDFTILGVSLDRDKDSWINAIKTDKLIWTQISDLKYWDSPVAKLYNVRTIPYSILIDKEGKILAKGLRGEKLAEKIKEVVK